MAETALVTTTSATPTDAATTAVQGSFDVLKAVINSPDLMMVAGVALCELLQWVKVQDYVPGHVEYIMGPDGTTHVIYVPDQPRRMLLSQLLSSTMETAIIGGHILKSAGGAAGVGDVLRIIRSFV